LALVGTISGSSGTSNTAVTGTLVIANTAVNFPRIASDAVLFVSGVIGGVSKSVIGGDLVVSGNSILQLDAEARGNLDVGLVSERLFNTSSAGGIMAFNLAEQTIFYVNNPTSNVTANFTNAPTTNLRAITPTVILSQSATPRIVNVVQIDTAAQTINWANGTTPTGTANKQDVFGFSLIRSGSTWKVLGQMSTYG